MSGALAALDGMVAALRADAGLRAFLRVPPGSTADATRVFDVYAPPGVQLEVEDGPDAGLPAPYVTVTLPRSQPWAVFRTAGGTHDPEVRVWAPGQLVRVALEGAAHVERVLDGRTLALPLTGHRALRCQLIDTITQTDPDAKATQARSRFAVDTLT